MNVELVPVAYAARVWPLVVGHVRSVEKHSGGDWTLDQLKADVLTGRVKMITGVDGGKVAGVVLYYISHKRNECAAFIVAFGGRMVTGLDDWAKVKAILTSEGATVVEGAVRKSMMRLLRRLGFEEKYAIAGVRL